MDIKVNELESTRKKDNDKNKDDGKRKARSYSKGSKDEYHEEMN